MLTTDLSSLSDREVLAETRRLAETERRSTAALVSLLELRVAQMRGRPSPGRLARVIVALRRGARASGELAARA